MDKNLTVAILSSGRFLYFKQTLNSLREVDISQNEIKILLFLNGFGIDIRDYYIDFLQNSGFNFRILLVDGIKQSELIKMAIVETRDLEYVLLCEDDWTFSPTLSMHEISEMKKLSLIYRQVCFSNSDRLQAIKNSGVNQLYFTLNPSIISQSVRNELLEKYDWVGDNSILDELERNFAQTLGYNFGESLYLYECECFIVKHIGVFSTRHYLTLIYKFGHFGEKIIELVSSNIKLSRFYQIVLKTVQNVLLLKSKIQ